MQNIYNVKIEWIEFAHSLLTKQWDNIFCGVSIICHIKYGTSGLPSHASLTFGTWDHMSASKWRKNPEMHILGSHILYACVAVKQRELLAYLIRHFTTHSAAEFRSLLLLYIWMIWIDISGVMEVGHVGGQGRTLLLSRLNRREKRLILSLIPSRVS